MKYEDKMNLAAIHVFIFYQDVDMPYRELIIETFYHVYNRGCNKQKLFFEVRDYNRFYANIERYLPDHPNIEIAAHCLLPNHFHFLVRESSPGLDSDTERSYQISSFLNRVQQALSLIHI